VAICQSGPLVREKFMKVAQASEIPARAISFVAPVLLAALQQPSAAEQIPPPYSRAEENARELNGRSE
jgi:hypothetical protein